MKLLINEQSLQILPSLALEVGLNEAIVLQQIHFRLRVSQNTREGHKWVYKTYASWQKDEFPFWSVDTIKRAIRRLENKGFIISTAYYNRMRMDKTKWYRIDYSLLHGLITQNAPPKKAEITLEESQYASTRQVNLHVPITKELKNIKNKHIELTLDVASVINYLNEKAGKHFKPTSTATEALVTARYREGYTLDDFKNVIDLKVKDWLHDAHWQKFLRPSTLFRATNFENYVEETRMSKVIVSYPQEPFELDFSKGED